MNTTLPLEIAGVPLPKHLAYDSAWAAVGRTWLGWIIPLNNFFASLIGSTVGECLTFTLVSFICLWTFYIPTYNFFRAIDKYNFLGLQKYKLHPGKFEPQDLNDRVVDGVRYGFWKGAVRTAVAYWFWFSHGRMAMVSFPTSFGKCVIDVLFGFVFNDFLFYFFHRACHHPRFYKFWHKQHHEFKVSNVGATAWNNPSESFAIMVLANTVALALGMDLFTWCAWIFFQNYNDHYVHSGYALPFDIMRLLVDPMHHDFHHYQNTGMYSITGWDALFGTDKRYKQWMARREELARLGKQEEDERRDDDKEGDEASSGYFDGREKVE